MHSHTHTPRRYVVRVMEVGDHEAVADLVSEAFTSQEPLTSHLKVRHDSFVSSFFAWNFYIIFLFLPPLQGPTSFNERGICVTIAGHPLRPTALFSLCRQRERHHCGRITKWGLLRLHSSIFAEYPISSGHSGVAGWIGSDFAWKGISRFETAYGKIVISPKIIFIIHTHNTHRIIIFIVMTTTTTSLLLTMHNVLYPHYYILTHLHSHNIGPPLLRRRHTQIIPRPRPRLKTSLHRQNIRQTTRISLHVHRGHQPHHHQHLEEVGRGGGGCHWPEHICDGGWEHAVCWVWVGGCCP